MSVGVGMGETWQSFRCTPNHTCMDGRVEGGRLPFPPAFLGSIGPGIDGQFFDVFCLADRVHIQRIACNVDPDREHPIFRFRGLPPSGADLDDAASWAFGGDGEVWVFLGGFSFVWFEGDVSVYHQVCDEAFICIISGEKCSCNAHGLVPFVWRLRPLKSRAESDDHQRPASPPWGLIGIANGLALLPQSIASRGRNLAVSVEQSQVRIGRLICPSYVGAVENRAWLIKHIWSATSVEDF